MDVKHTCCHLLLYRILNTSNGKLAKQVESFKHLEIYLMVETGIQEFRILRRMVTCNFHREKSLLFGQNCLIGSKNCGKIR